MEIDLWQAILGVIIGLGLSAACGFRILLPPFLMGLAVKAGMLHLSDGFLWMGSWLAIIAFGVASLFEILAYFIPWVDNMLDTISTPTAIIAGVLVTAAAAGEMTPLLKWSLAVIGGGSAAGLVQGSTVAVRAISTGTTGGLANPLVSLVEVGLAGVMSVVAIVAPVLGAILLVVVIGFAINRILAWRRKKRAKVVVVS